MNKGKYLSFIFSLSILLSLIVFFSLQFFFVFKDDGLNYILIFASLASISTVFIEQIYSIYRIELKSKEFKNFAISTPILKLVFVLILVYLFKLNEISIFLATIFSSLVIVIIYFKRLRKEEDTRIQIVNPIQNKEILKTFLVYGIPLTSSVLFSIIISNSDRILINYFLDESAVAIYSLSYDISFFLIGNVFMIINFTFVPVILKYIDKSNLKAAREKIQNYFWLINFVILPLALCLYFLAPYVSKYILGESYYSEESIQIISLMGIGALLSGLKAYFFDLSFQFGKKTYIQVVPIAIGALINVGLNLVWIPLFDLKGALYSTIISYFIALIISVVLGSKVFPLAVKYKKIILLYLQITIIFLIFNFIFKFDVNAADPLADFFKIIIVGVIYIVINLKGIKEVLR